jgi:DNA excision repair protein ERCC-4
MTRPSLKPQQITIICDTREQTPLDFSSLDIPVERGTLDTGDYSVKGLTHHVRVERKSLPDLVACVTRERDRFEREMMRLVAFESRMLVVEAHWIDIEAQKYRSKTHPNAVIASLMAWQERYALPIIMAGDPKRAAIMTGRFLFMAARRRYQELQSFRENLA